MSIALRNFEEGDAEAVLALMAGQAGAELAASNYLLPESLRPQLLMDTAFGLVAEEDGHIAGTAWILMEQETEQTVVGLLSRLCVNDGPSRSAVAANLVTTALQSVEDNVQHCFVEIPTTDLWQQAACEQAGFVPCGFLPHKFHGNPRGNAVVYAYLTENARNQRRPHPEIVSSARDLAVEALKGHGMIEDVEIREDVVAYPTECNFTLAPIDTSAVQTILEGQNRQENEIFRSLQGTQTHLNLLVEQPVYLAAKDGDRVVGVIGYIVDHFDKRIQITDVITLEGDPQGFMIASLLEAQAQDDAPELDYWEVMVSAHAPRMQKTLDQVGFVPCAYIPSFGMEHGLRADAIKMVKLDTAYEAATGELTSACKNIYTIIDTIFREHGVGTAVLKLLRDLSIFRGLGEGELRRVARLFSQKLLRPGEVVFEEGSAGSELYVIERGEIEIKTKEGDKLLGTIRSGGVIGEIAFLNGEPRTAYAVSKSATIVRVIYRTDFDRLIQHEVHLGLIFFQNVALDLAGKLKQSVVQAKTR